MNTEKIKKLCSYRDVGHENVDQLMWVTEDKGGFGNEKDGPLFDWIEGKDKFLQHIKQFNVVIQAGGNCGMYPRFYKNYFKHVYSFEPDDTNFYCMSVNCTGSGYHLYHGGIGDNIGSLTLVKGHNKNVGTHKIQDQPGDVKMYRIDDINVEHCDLIHLDIEGFEERALIGARRTIEKFFPVIITERARGKDWLAKYGYVEKYKLKMDSVFVRDEPKTNI